MQKIRNRSLFFQKIFHIRYIAKNFESVQALSGILPKILKTVPLFWKNLPHRVYFQNFWKRSRFSELFSKNLSMASSGRPDIGISAISYAPIRQIRQNSPLSGLFPKSPSTVPFLSNFFQKNCLSTADYRQNTPKRSHPFFNFFQKTFIFYRGYFQNDTPLCCRFQKKIRKKSSPHHWLSRLPPRFVTLSFNFFSKIFIPPLLTITFFLLFVSSPMLLFWKIPL